MRRADTFHFSQERVQGGQFCTNTYIKMGIVLYRNTLVVHISSGRSVNLRNIVGNCMNQW